VRFEAAKCLGEIGPIDLGTLVMNKEEGESTEYSTPEKRLVDAVAALLAHIIHTEELAVKRIACDALYEIMRCDGASTQNSYCFAPFQSDVSWCGLPQELFVCLFE